MGKRELMLAGVFVLLGVIVYQLSAPAADPSRPGFSIGRIMDEVRREIRGRSASAERRETTQYPVAASVRELRLNLPIGTLTIVGEDRADIEADFYVRSNGYDEEEAARLVKASRLKVDEAGELFIMTAEFPREGRQTPTLALKVPSRLAFRMEGKQGALTAQGLASVTIGSARGETTVTGIAGLVSLTQRGQTIKIDGAGSLRLTTVGGADARVSNIKGETTLNLQSGQLTAEHLTGPLELEARSARMRFERLDDLRGPVRINATSGELTMLGLRTETRIDGRDTDVRIEQAAAAPLSIYNTGSDLIEVTLPQEGFKIDALAIEGGVSLDEALQKQGLTVAGTPEATPDSRTRREERVVGTLRGGGPTVTLRATRGNIVLRTK